MELIIVTLFLILFLLKFKMRETFWERNKIDLYFYPGYAITCICYLVIIAMYFFRDSEMNMIATLFNVILSLPIIIHFAFTFTNNDPSVISNHLIVIFILCLLLIFITNPLLSKKINPNQTGDFASENPKLYNINKIHISIYIIYVISYLVYVYLYFTKYINVDESILITEESNTENIEYEYEYPTENVLPDNSDSIDNTDIDDDSDIDNNIDNDIDNNINTDEYEYDIEYIKKSSLKKICEEQLDNNNLYETVNDVSGINNYFYDKNNSYYDILNGNKIIKFNDYCKISDEVSNDNIDIDEILNNI